MSRSRHVRIAATEPDDHDPKPPAKKRRTDDGPNQDESGKANGQQAPTDSSGQNPPVIDESLYSRQLYVLGRDAMLRMAQSDVMVCGMGGLGVEIAKNTILGGVKSVTVHDEAVCSRHDLSSQYYLSEERLGENRASASEASLARLNQYVRVEAHTELLNEEFLKQFNVVVLTEASLEQQEDVAAVTRKNNISLIVADTRGLAGQIFCDFGGNFRVVDPNGEEPLSVLITSITNDRDGVVTCLTRHGFEDGDYVSFSEVRGMSEINNCPPMKVKVLGPHTFSIGDTTQFGEYTQGGVATQVKIPKDIKFKSFQESLAKPDFITSDFAKIDRPLHLHLGFQALHEFQRLHSRLPRPWNKEDAEEVVRLARQKNARLATPLENIDERLITILSYVSAGSLCPMQAVIGSIAAQEVMKACSGKFNPIRQWFYFDAFECLPRECSRIGSECQRNELICCVMPHAKIGAEAIGCELLKNFAMMGLGANDGLIHVTDMDVIERSNLNRQFLFRPEDVGRMKSTTATKAVRQMNPEVNIVDHEDRVGPETENVYNDDFFESLDGVANALDNLDARLFMDKLCMYYRKPLLESGTMGTKGNVQVVKPDLTESYSSSHDPPEKIDPRLHNQALSQQHRAHPADSNVRDQSNSGELIEAKPVSKWALDEFEGLFNQAAANAVQLLKVHNEVVRFSPADIDTCYGDFTLRNCFSSSQITSSGAPFWSGFKRCPHPIEFDHNNSLHMDYIVAAANLRATMFGIPHNTNREMIAEMLEEVEVPAFNPQPNPDPNNAADNAADYATDNSADNATDNDAGNEADNAVDNEAGNAVDNAVDDNVDNTDDNATDDAVDNATNNAAGNADSVVPNMGACGTCYISVCLSIFIIRQHSAI
ncbi:hypothetical protein MRX96_039588 [Rhipicephalus microplus]